ncbi:hypothetical protein DM01DRAFT_1323805 [Hesseltinella vesiculosa]|uniref:Phospholipid/glycerol acyltransferase domain-containing protein n=1 Tax=Hesseltinella vesiculosa TaxID=101127 RepID=A0A1X2GEG7_9FUNG|nr:hypothetical protein DM01DRAFT_1323805 [Hesseltinella vesiculosa]
MPFGLGHELVILISRASLWSFFTDIKLEHAERAPKDIPLIVAATHHNMICDPAVLSVTYPEQRRLHYWAKNTLFKNPHASAFFTNCGVLPVDRTTKDNALLYKHTLESLRIGESIAVFPEGTSHSLPHLGVFKDGASFAALEYAKSIVEDPSPNADGSLPKSMAVLPVGIVYPQKSKYRSSVIVQYGEPIYMDKYLPIFLKDPKKGAKMLTHDMKEAIEKLTVNAPDWHVRDASEMARHLLFPGEVGMMKDYVPVIQSLINSFVTLGMEDKYVIKLQESLLAYKLELDDLLLMDSHIANYNEKNITKAATSINLLRQTAASLVDLLLFFSGVLVHLPLYIAGHYAGKMTIFEEARAQGKIVYGIALLPVMYFVGFLLAWYTLFGGTFFGMLVAMATTGVFFWYHNVSIDERYDNFKDLLGRWRIFDATVLGRGMWRRKERILKLKELRQANLTALRAFIKEHKSDNDDVHVVWDAIRTRSQAFGDVSRLHGRRRKLAKQYEWSFEG